MNISTALCLLMVMMVLTIVGCSARSKKGKQMIAIGAMAPDFTLLDEQGVEHTLSAVRGKKVVIYFYPKDDTPGCTQQACSIRDGYAALRKAGITLFGISADSTESHRKFKEKYHLPFSLLSDSNKAVAARYGVKGMILLNRVTFLIDESGRIISKLDDVDVAHHADQIMQAFSNR